MLDQLLKLVEENAQQQVIQNKSIPDQFNNAVIKEISTQIHNGLKDQVSQGNMQQVIALFQSGTGKPGTNSVVNGIASSVVTNLTSRFGLPQDVAQSVAGNVVHSVIAHVIRKANDPRDIDFDLQQMMRGMSGNSSLDISGMMPTSSKGAIGNIFGKLFGK